MAIYLDTEDPMTSPELEVTATAPERWNGFEVPIATAPAFRAFIAAWQEMDPNGTWEPRGVSVSADGRLVYIDGDGTEDSWEVYGVTAGGESTYALDGWTWVDA
ncbi:hypothetical protein FE374_05145 [Georgenia yuyongxinii]|uniref:Uncharacterized protein n=1 Tax=Georgenia yuyongxinii TaxID=2589797 RepID=A0A5B8C0Y6_9MICO|nr:hypothetical protein [Georgenia yuyongxinii]QDC24098.1 hypothetical protein FE374_05145 [Georgenia yuyongxinii]